MRRASSLAAGFGDVPTGDFAGLYGVLEHRPYLLHRDAREPRDEARSRSLSTAVQVVQSIIRVDLSIPRWGGCP